MNESELGWIHDMRARFVIFIDIKKFVPKGLEGLCYLSPIENLFCIDALRETGFLSDLLENSS
jgi:hypothetical protein